MLKIIRFDGERETTEETNETKAKTKNQTVKESRRKEDNSSGEGWQKMIPLQNAFFRNKQMRCHCYNFVCENESKDSTKGSSITRYESEKQMNLIFSLTL